MQSLVRHASRPVFDASLFSIPKTKCRVPASSRHVLAVQQCLLQPQRRQFADEPKPTTTLHNSQQPVSESPEEQNPTIQSSWGSTPLPSVSERRRSHFSKRISHIMENLQGNIFIASQRLNDLTGYSAIEVLKASISKLEVDLAKVQEDVQVARQTYKTTIASRAASQREVTTLLARKDTWTPIDLERFTSLYRSDHGNEHAVQEAATRLADVERIAEKTANKLSTSILSRYHEEQVLSDKIRAMSTWGTWGLMGLNVLLFLVFQLGFEPWRRERLVRGFEEKVKIALDREKADRITAHREQKAGVDEKVEESKLDGVVAAGVQELEMDAKGTQKDDPAVEVLVDMIVNDATDSVAVDDSIEPTTIKEKSLQQLGLWRCFVLDLFSEKVISLKKQDVTMIALEGAASGAAVAGLVVMYILRPS